MIAVLLEKVLEGSMFAARSFKYARTESLVQSICGMRIRCL